MLLWLSSYELGATSGLSGGGQPCAVAVGEVGVVFESWFEVGGASRPSAELGDNNGAADARSGLGIAPVNIGVDPNPAPRTLPG